MNYIQVLVAKILLEQALDIVHPAGASPSAVPDSPEAKAALVLVNRAKALLA